MTLLTLYVIRHSSPAGPCHFACSGGDALPLVHSHGLQFPGLQGQRGSEVMDLGVVRIWGPARITRKLFWASPRNAAFWHLHSSIVQDVRLIAPPWYRGTCKGLVTLQRSIESIFLSETGHQQGVYRKSTNSA